MARIEARLKELGFELPVPPATAGFYVPALQCGTLVITSGQLPFVGRELAFVGKLGAELHEQDGFNAARLCALNALAQIHACVGDLDQVKRIVRVEGYVNSAPGFNAQAFVMNGASELLVEAFGEAGKHTRIAVGVAEMPLDAAVQVAITAELKPQT